MPKSEKMEGLGRQAIEKAIDESLLRLGTDYVDLFYAHIDDNETELEETLETFDSLVKTGKVRAIGCSNYRFSRLLEAMAISQSKDGSPIAASSSDIRICSLEQMRISECRSVRMRTYLLTAVNTMILRSWLIPPSLEAYTTKGSCPARYIPERGSDDPIAYAKEGCWRAGSDTESACPCLDAAQASESSSYCCCKRSNAIGRKFGGTSATN